MSKKTVTILGIILVIIIVAVGLFALLPKADKNKPKDIQYDEVVSYFQNGRVGEYTLDLQTGTLTIMKLDGEQVDIIFQISDIEEFSHDTGLLENQLIYK